MKRYLLFLIILILSPVMVVSSQIPQAFNYQAIARNSSGEPIINTELQVRITIQSDSLTGTSFWVEEHPVVQTNDYGLFTLSVGKGVRQPASIETSFSDIDWSVTPKFLKTEVNYGGWKTMGASRLQTVPYAMTAGGLTGSVNKLQVKSNMESPDSALFEVKNNTGQTVFAVYNEGVRVYVDNGDIKGSKGGFAIGGFASAKAAPQEFFRVTADSTRIYVNDIAKGTKGGFAIGGFASAKAVPQEYLRVTADSTRIYVNDIAKGSKGGFAIGGFNSAKSASSPYLQLNPENYFIGLDAGVSNTTGLYNSFMGFEAGKNNTTGYKNVFVGYRSGISNNTGYGNVFIGDSVGVLNTFGSKNVFIGDYAGRKNLGSNNIYIGYQVAYNSQNGSQNIFIGNYSGYNNATSQNLFIGEYAGEKNTSGTRNSFVGFFAGQLNQTGGQNSYFGQFAGMDNTKSYNTFIGYWAGGDNVDGEKDVFLGYRAGQGSNGSNNVFLGYQAGEGNTGSGNVLIGYQAGSYSGSKSNVLYIDNSSTSTPLIYGDFNTNRLSFNGSIGVNRSPYSNVSLSLSPAGLNYGLYVDAGATSYAAYFSGSAYTTGSWSSSSDIRYKKNIVSLSNSLSSVLSLQGVSYNWNTEDYPDKGFTDAKQIGLIAQDVEKILPELVSSDQDGYKAVDYSKLTPVLIEAIKEQQKQIDELKELVNTLMENQK